MTNNYKVYYIPTNPQITKGHIYTFYLNNNTNLDLSSIITTTSPLINPQPSRSPSPQIIISTPDYQKLLDLNTKLNQLSTERTSAIQSFIQKENNLVNAMTKINNERQELIKNLKKGQ